MNYIQNRNIDVIKLLSSQLPIAIWIGLCIASIYTIEQVIFSPIVKNEVLAWFLVFFFVQIFRLLLLRIGDSVVSHQQIRRWFLIFRLGVIFSGLLWGFSSTFFLGSEIQRQVVISFMLAGITAGSIHSLAADRISSLCFIVTALLPQATYYLMQDATLGMGLMMIGFMIFLILVSLKNTKTLHSNFDLKHMAVESENRAKETLDFSPIAGVIVDIDQKQALYANQSFKTLMQQLGGPDFKDCIESQAGFDEVFEKVTYGEVIKDILMQFKTTESEQIWVLASFVMTNYHEKPAVLCWFYDITDRKQMEEKVQHQAHHDHLTGLPNRILFQQSVQQLIEADTENNKIFALLFVDLDGFKQVNDQYGHDVGDELLILVSKRMNAVSRSCCDIVARLGGDEFGFIISGLKNSDDAFIVSEKIFDSVAAPYMINGRTVTISLSIGIALYPLNGHDYTTLLKRADTVMYQAKKSDREKIQLFS